MKNEQAVYRLNGRFIRQLLHAIILYLGMAGENLDYGDQDFSEIEDLK